MTQKPPREPVLTWPASVSPHANLPHNEETLHIRVKPRTVIQATKRGI